MSFSKKSLLGLLSFFVIGSLSAPVQLVNPDESEFFTNLLGFLYGGGADSITVDRNAFSKNSKLAGDLDTLLGFNDFCIDNLVAFSEPGKDLILKVVQLEIAFCPRQRGKADAMLKILRFLNPRGILTHKGDADPKLETLKSDDFESGEEKRKRFVGEVVGRHLQSLSCRPATTSRSQSGSRGLRGLPARRGGVVTPPMAFPQVPVGGLPARRGGAVTPPMAFPQVPVGGLPARRGGAVTPPGMLPALPPVVVQPNMSTPAGRYLALKSCYNSGYEPPVLNENFMRSSNFQNVAARSKVYVSASELGNISDAAIIKSIFEREPVNIAMARSYDEEKLRRLLGWELGNYQTYFDRIGKIFPNVAVYCHTPVVGKAEDYLVHMINVSGFALDSGIQPDYQYFIQDGSISTQKKDELIDRMTGVFDKIFQCAIDVKAKGIVLSAFGCFSFAGLYPNGGGSGFANEIYGPAITRSLGRWAGQLRASDVRNISTMGNPAHYPANIISIINTTGFVHDERGEDAVPTGFNEYELFVNAWDPHSVAGNGNDLDTSLDGWVGRSTAVASLCWPGSNPNLDESKIIKVPLSQEVAPAVVPLSAGQGLLRHDFRRPGRASPVNIDSFTAKLERGGELWNAVVQSLEYNPYAPGSSSALFLDPVYKEIDNICSVSLEQKYKDVVDRYCSELKSLAGYYVKMESLYHERATDGHNGALWDNSGLNSARELAVLRPFLRELSDLNINVGRNQRLYVYRKRKEIAEVTIQETLKSFVTDLNKVKGGVALAFEDVDSCAFCFDGELDPSSESFSKLGCKHLFHTECLHPWASQSEIKWKVNEDNQHFQDVEFKTCPVCRAGISQGERNLLGRHYEALLQRVQ